MLLLRNSERHRAVQLRDAGDTDFFHLLAGILAVGLGLELINVRIRQAFPPEPTKIAI
jgi:hypothetical protein